MADHEEKRIVDLSHVIEHGMTTYKGFPGPVICDFWDRETTAADFDDARSRYTFRDNASEPSKASHDRGGER